MILRSLDIRSFRCIRQLHVDFTDGLNVLYGPNELGKSTLIEALRAAFLLPVNSKVAEDFVPWGTDDTPQVVVEFELPARAKPKGAETQPAATRWRVRKSFGRGRNQSAILERVTDHGRSVEQTRGRDVDGQLRELLDWGIQGPGGRGAPRGWPQSYLVTALLGDQDGVAKIFETSLDVDGTDSGRNCLTAALGVLAQAPEVTALLDRLHLRTSEVFTDKGQKRRTQDSPLVKITELKRNLQSRVETLEDEQHKAQEIADGISHLRHEQQRVDTDVARLDREVELLTQTLKSRELLRDSTDRKAKQEQAIEAFKTADGKFQQKNAGRRGIQSELESAEKSHGQAKQTLSSHEARLKQLTETRGEALESRRRQLEADRKTAEQRASIAQRAITTAGAVEHQSKAVDAAFREVEKSAESRHRAARELQRALRSNVKLAKKGVSTADSVATLAKLTAERDELNRTLESAASADEEFQRLSRETTQAEDEVNRLKSDRSDVQRMRDTSLDAAKQAWKQRQKRADQRRELEAGLQKAEADEHRVRSYLNAIDRFGEVQQRLTDTTHKQIDLNSDREISEQKHSVLTDELGAATRSASLCLMTAVSCAIGAILILGLAIVITSGRVAMFSVSGGLGLALVVLALRWKRFANRRSQVTIEREATSKAIDRLTLQALNTESELAAAQREFDACERSLPNELMERFETLDAARLWLEKKLPQANEEQTRLKNVLTELDQSGTDAAPEATDSDTAALDEKLKVLDERITIADATASTLRTQRDQAQTRLEQALKTVSATNSEADVDPVSSGKTRLQRLDAQIAECIAEVGWPQIHPIPTVDEASRDKSAAEQQLVAAKTAYKSRAESLAPELKSDASEENAADEEVATLPVIAVDEVEQQWRLALDQHTNAEDELKQQQAALKEKQATAQQSAQELEKPATEQLAEATQILAGIEGQLADLDAGADSNIESANLDFNAAQKAESEQAEHVLALKQQLKVIDEELSQLQETRELAKTARDKAEENSRQFDTDSITAELRLLEQSRADEFPNLEISIQQLELSKQQRIVAQEEQKRISRSLHEARGKLELSGGEVLRENLEAAQAEMERVEAASIEQELEYDALHHLQQTLLDASQQHSAHLGKSLARPVAEQFRVLTGHRYANLHIDKDLQLKTVSTDTAERPRDAMSVGTRHQLATLIRLALAAQLQTTVVLDDQLVHSDAERLLWFRDRLRQSVAENQFQAVVVTCRPLDYITEIELKSGSVSLPDAADSGASNLVNLATVLS